MWLVAPAAAVALLPCTSGCFQATVIAYLKTRCRLTLETCSRQIWPDCTSSAVCRADISSSSVPCRCQQPSLLSRCLGPQGQ